VVAPLPLAGNRPWAMALLGIAVLALLVHHLLRPERPGDDEERQLAEAPWRRAKLAWLAMSAWVALIAVQLLPLPASWIAVMHFGRDVAWWDGAGSWARITVDPYSTRLYLLKAIALLAFFALLLRLTTNESRVELLAKAVVVSGVVQAVVGISLFAVGARYSLFFVKVEHSSVTGTFVNHNHLAGYLEMALAVGIGLMAGKLEDRRATTWRLWLRDWLAVLVSDKARLRLMLVVMVIALIGSRSRMGNGAFVVSLFLAGGVAIVLSKRAPRAMVVFIASLLILDIVVIGSMVGLDKVMLRIQQTQIVTRHADAGGASQARAHRDAAGTEVAGAASPSQNIERQESLEQRAEAGRQALDAARHFPLLGAGGGTFHMAFMPFRSPDLPGYFDHAHNDYAEVLVETGMVGFALLAVIAGASLVHAMRILILRRHRFARGMAFASLMGGVALLLHSIVDFNLQIPANAMAFLVVLTLPYLVGSTPRHEAPSLEFRRQSR